MSKDEMTSVISDCCNDVIFVYNSKKSGITSEVKDHVPTFQAWHGSEVKEYNNVDDVINDNFFSGKSIIEIMDVVTFSFI